MIRFNLIHDNLLEQFLIAFILIGSIPNLGYRSMSKFIHTYVIILLFSAVIAQAAEIPTEIPAASGQPPEVPAVVKAEAAAVIAEETIAVEAEAAEVIAPETVAVEAEAAEVIAEETVAVEAEATAVETEVDEAVAPEVVPDMVTEAEKKTIVPDEKVD